MAFPPRVRTTWVREHWRSRPIKHKKAKSRQKKKGMMRLYRF